MRISIPQSSRRLSNTLRFCCGREPDQAEVLERVARGQEQEHSECCVYPKDHAEILWLRRQPTPAGRPRYREGVDPNNKDDTDKCENDAQRARYATSTA